MNGIQFDLRDVVLFAVGSYRYLLLIYIIVNFLQSLAGLRVPDWLRPALNFIYDACEPFLRIFRGMLPAVSMGGMGLDLSPILAFIVLFIIEAVLARVL